MTPQQLKVKSENGEFYKKAQCPSCRKKVKVIRVTSAYRRLAVHALPSEPYVQCSGSGKQIE